MRDRLIHGYDWVDIDELGKTATEDVPALIEQTLGRYSLAALENVPSFGLSKNTRSNTIAPQHAVHNEGSSPSPVTDFLDL